MKTVIILIFGIALIILVAAKYQRTDFHNDVAGGIQFHKGDWQEALNLAQSENKLIFLDIYATWCGPCKRLKSKTFSDSDVGTYYNNNFINVALNGEEGEGALLARKFNIRGYPSLLYIDHEGKVVFGTAGYHNTKSFIDLGKTVMKSTQ
jgi:thioredoxin